ncbi:PPC domain-containing DNA-binding protein [Vallitalea guaymasensis]|uniref:DNA-binding protein n=1 Tax=Vallitalea guaymasensis TaxID=1185412 RepID=A0A8J8MA76_9FIRM|nr:PPC domain-containing DNA-binding protein [Vallitalea guaymasensis]QUH29236.1 DNA-binding protein [Vallitalea guaymasensis]
MLYILNIPRNGDIKNEIIDFVLKKGWEKAYISGAIGSVTDICMVNPQNDNIPPNLKGETISGPSEILSFSGEVMKKKYMSNIMKKIYTDDDKPYFIHIHISCSTKGQKVYGGGLRKCTAFLGLKIFLHEIY